MKSNFAFLKDAFPVLANLGELAEKYCYSDPNSCLIKLGMIGETVVNLMFTYDKIALPEDNAQANKIYTLNLEGLLSSDLAAILHGLRKIRNKAVHDNYSSVNDSKSYLEMAYGLCEWFMQVYGDWHYEHHDFLMPSKNDIQELQIVDKADEQAKEDQLAAEAQKKAETAPDISKEERKKLVDRADSQRKMTEAETRYLIDNQLCMVGWEADTGNIRYSEGVRPAMGHNYAIAEYPTDSESGKKGYADYALFAEDKLIGIIEAKRAYKDVSSVIDYQCKEYAKCIRQDDAEYQIGSWDGYKVPFVFATNGRPYLEQYKEKSGIWFLDLRKKSNIPKALKGWMSPEGMKELLAADAEKANAKLAEMPDDFLTDEGGLNLRTYQVKAIKAVENAIIKGQDKVLLAMATGTGKTRTILGMIYRFLKTGRFRRILFLVDRNALGEQAMDVFKEVKIENLKALNQIYDIKSLDDATFDKTTRVHVATVQGMVKRIMYNNGEIMPAVSDYDLIIVDEAHRGYIFDREMSDNEIFYRDQRDYQSKYRAVIDYFNAAKVAMTATPALHTTQIFGAPVFQYTYREAVIDGYLVDHDAPHSIKTKLSTEGIHYKHGDKILLFDPDIGDIKESWLLEDDELNFDVGDFNKEVVVRSFNEAVLQEIADNIDPGQPNTKGKTLIYAVNDAHADMIVNILRGIYSKKGLENAADAIKKITGKVGDRKRINQAIREFKNESYPSIAVTVDLLTTGIDVPKITTLVFMRRIKSRILFEQMLGRATRLCPEINKTHFEIYDAVGTYESLEPVSSMKVVVANPGISFTGLIDGLEKMEDEQQLKAQIQQIIARLQRRKNNMAEEAVRAFTRMTGGMDPDHFIADIRRRDPADARERLIACREVFDMLGKLSKDGEIVISEQPDTVTEHSRRYGKNNLPPRDYLEEFAEYIKNNINEIAALKVICTRPRDLKREDLVSLQHKLALERYTEDQLNTAASQLKAEKEKQSEKEEKQPASNAVAADIISWIRRAAIGSNLMSHGERIKKAIEKLKAAHKFSESEEKWINIIGNYLLTESVLSIGAFDNDYRFKDEGGYDRMNEDFGNNLAGIIDELNEYLYEDGGTVA